MDRRVRNFLAYGLVLILLILSLLSPYVGKDQIWKKENNVARSFNGLSFDIPENISQFSINRSLENEEGESLITYDIEFEYSGRPSNMRVVGQVSRQAFFPEAPSFSKVNLKGGYDDVNQVLFNERLHLRQYYKNVDPYLLEANSTIRVPLNEDTKNYSFSLSYNPRELVYKENDKISDMAVFVTNARVDAFTDTNTSENIKQESFIESGLYVNQFERFTDGSITSINTYRNIGSGIFILSFVLMLILIWTDNTSKRALTMLLMMVSILSFYKLAGVGISTRGLLLIYPILGIFVVLVSNIMPRENIRLNRSDFSQAIAGGLLALILAILVFVVPPTI